MFTLMLSTMVVWAGCDNGDGEQLTVKNVPSKQIKATPGGYVGSGPCEKCHGAIHTSWIDSQHNKKINTLDEWWGPGIIADSDQDGVDDFKEGIVLGKPTAGGDPDYNSSVAFFNIYNESPANTPVLGYDAGRDMNTITIGPKTYDVDFTMGGKWKQRYVTIIGKDWYILPVQYDPTPNSWTVYNPHLWYTWTDDGDNNPEAGEGPFNVIYGPGETPVTKGKTTDSWQRKCVGCHATGLESVTADAKGEIIAKFSQRNISCEACHGPGLNHVSLGGGKGTIINPDSLSPAVELSNCGKCHTRGDGHYDVLGKTVAWPWHPDNSPFKIGELVNDYYDEFGYGTKGIWGDVAFTAKQHHQQYQEARRRMANVQCNDCHDPHGSSWPSSTRLNPDNNDLCLSCHNDWGPGMVPPGAATNAQGLIVDISGHTNHDVVNGIRPAPGNGSQCVSCHMPYTAKSSYNYDIRSHHFQFLYPEESKKLGNGRPNGCMTSACHTSKDISVNKWSPSSAANNDAATALITALWGNLAPVAGTQKIKSSWSISGDGPIFTLDGSGSFDPNGDAINYNWLQTGGPAVALSNSAAAAPTFTAVFPGVYVFYLYVDDGPEDGAPVKVEVVVMP